MEVPRHLSPILPFPFKGFIILYFLIATIRSTGFGQVELTADTTISKIPEIQDDSVYYKHSPRKATIYAMVFPGLGQAYNKKYWKIPIVYAGFGTLIYFINTNDKQYKDYRKAYLHSLINDALPEDEKEPPINDYEKLYETSFLLDAKNFYRRNRDLSYILTGVWYLLQMVDATVDAHLLTWDVGEDLSLNVQPMFNPYAIGNKPISGLTFSLRF
jgi:hypothetical protein